LTNIYDLSLRNPSSSSGLYDDCLNEVIVPSFSLDIDDESDSLLESEHIPFSMSSYCMRYMNLLSCELEQKESDIRTYDLYEIKINRSQKYESFAYSFKVPGVIDDMPELVLGDVLKIRMDSNSENSLYEWRIPISGITRKSQMVYFACPDYDFPHNTGKFNVKFQVHRWKFDLMAFCVKYLSGFTDSIRTNPAVITEWLFPVMSSTTIDDSTDSKRSEITLRNTQLNIQQKSAIRCIVYPNHGKAPFIVSGPPGTGKTLTLVESIIQVRKYHPSSRILVCAPSDSAADTIASRLHEKIERSTLLRLYLPSRDSSEVPGILSIYTKRSDTTGLFTIPTLKELLRYKVVVTTCFGCSLLFQSGIINSRMNILKSEITNDWNGESSTDSFWTHLFIDEAAQATEPETLIPLSVVAPPPNGNYQLTNIILCGDHKQLGPKVASKIARKNGLRKSLMERLMDSSLYYDHPLARHNILKLKGKANNSRFDHVPSNNELWSSPPAFVNLFKSYRSHSQILEIVSDLFYSNTLEVGRLHSEGKDYTKIFKDMANFSNDFGQIVTVHVAGQDEMVDECSSWFNIKEIATIESILVKLVSQENVNPKDIGVIIPFRHSVKLLRRRLRKKKYDIYSLRDVDVGTVLDYQGKEYDIIILATIRTRSRFISQDSDNGKGVVGDHARNQMNVAISRARDCLIIVGNMDFLSSVDPYWKKLIQYVSLHGVSVLKQFCRINSQDSDNFDVKVDCE
jgi:helicase MOV-10